MKLATCIATVAAAGALAATVGVGTAVAEDQEILAPVLTDNTTLVPNSVDPLGAATYELDSNIYTVTVVNPNADGVFCGVAVVGADLATLTPVQLFPDPADWDSNSNSWVDFPGAVPGGQSRTYTVDTSGVNLNDFEVLSVCATDTETGPVVLRHLYRTTGLPAFGS